MTSVRANFDQEITSRFLKLLETSPVKRTFLLGMVLAIMTGALYYPVRHHPFTSYDDRSYVTENIHVKYGLDWQAVRWAFTTSEPEWHPLTWLSHGLDCQLFYLQPRRHHEMNVLLHAMNAGLLFWVLLRATGYAGRSFIVAALFALHPINVESVAWIAERKNLLSMLFLLLALGAYRWYVQKPHVDRYAVVFFLYMLGLLAKAQIITFPCLLLLWDYWPLQRMFACSDGSTSGTQVVPAKKLSWLLLEKVPLFALSIADAALTVHAHRVTGVLNPIVLVLHPLSTRLENAAISYSRYIGKAFWPSRLTVLYPYSTSSIRGWQVFASSFLLLLVSSLVIKRRHLRYLLVGWFWFVGTLLPMIGIVYISEQAMADRYAYLPLVGLFIMIAYGVADWAEERYVSPAWLAGLSVAVLLALAAVTHRQIGYWQDDVALWSHATQVTSGNWEAENHLGLTLLNNGQIEKAIPHLRRAESMSPSNPWTQLYIGVYEQQKGNLAEAIERYRRVIDMTQNDIALYASLRVPALTRMASAYWRLGDSAQAYESLEAARSEGRRAIQEHSELE